MNNENMSQKQDEVSNDKALSDLINRVKLSNKTCPSREYSIAITKLEEALMWLNKLDCQLKGL